MIQITMYFQGKFYILLHLCLKRSNSSDAKNFFSKNLQKMHHYCHKMAQVTKMGLLRRMEEKKKSCHLQKYAYSKLTLVLNQ